MFKVQYCPPNSDFIIGKSYRWIWSDFISKRLILPLFGTEIKWFMNDLGIMWQRELEFTHRKPGEKSQITAGKTLWRSSFTLQYVILLMCLLSILSHCPTESVVQVWHNLSVFWVVPIRIVVTRSAGKWIKLNLGNGHWFTWFHYIAYTLFLVCMTRQCCKSDSACIRQSP